jgi:hypothetical protein
MGKHFELQRAWAGFKLKFQSWQDSFANDQMKDLSSAVEERVLVLNLLPISQPSELRLLEKEQKMPFQESQPKMWPWT